MNVNDTVNIRNISNVHLPVCMVLDRSASMLGITTEVASNLIYLQDKVSAWGQEVSIDGNIVCIPFNPNFKATRISEHIAFVNDLLGFLQNINCVVDLCVVTIGNEEGCITQSGDSDFVGFDEALERLQQLPNIELKNRKESKIGKNVNLALDAIERQVRHYQAENINFFKPWLVVVSDGIDSGENWEWKRAVDRVVEKDKNGFLVPLPYRCGDSGKSVLGELIPGRFPYARGSEFDKTHVLFYNAPQMYGIPRARMAGEWERIDKSYCESVSDEGRNVAVDEKLSDAPLYTDDFVSSGIDFSAMTDWSTLQ